MTMHDRTANGAVIPPPIKNPNFSKYQRRFPTIQYLRRGAQRRLPHFAYEYGDGGAGAGGQGNEPPKEDNRGIELTESASKNHRSRSLKALPVLKSKRTDTIPDWPRVSE
jgi:hypothetical protein